MVEMKIIMDNYMDVIGRAKLEPEPSINPDRTSCTSPLFAMTTMDGGNENNAWTITWM